ncbi:MAG: hypothetical protein KF833_03335 [Verrucomicrobiae bacterium]|nr:hypothetical protein [Verrucomicrobiae bacterium]
MHRRIPPLGLLVGVFCTWNLAATALNATVEIEEPVYQFAPAQNGAGPMWCHGSTSLVRIGDIVFATGLETLPELPPLNNCRWNLWRRDNQGWQRIHVDDPGRTREPSPLAVLGPDQIWVSANPTLNPPGTAGGGPARPELVRFPGRPPFDPKRELPVWDGQPRFTEHSYRSLAADGPGGELLLLQNIDYAHAEWAFRDRRGHWSAQGRLTWPWGADYPRPQPIRLCYPNVALRQRAVHFLGVSDILEPRPEWRAARKEITGRDWDYDFRRLFYSWTPDLTREAFRPWIEIASRESTAGSISSADLHVAPDGHVHLLWMEKALDERLRERFFPDARQAHSLEYAVIRDGQVVRRRTLLRSTGEAPGPVASAARFHPLPDGRLLVFAHLRDAGTPGHSLFEVTADGWPGIRIPVTLQYPLTSFFTATPRAGTEPSTLLDLLGMTPSQPDTLRYVRIRITP